ncbi:Uncharacterised protein [Salmonella enterica]|nr:Uncharacterised protein [Salmonella enterica]
MIGITDIPRATAVTALEFTKLISRWWNAACCTDFTKRNRGTTAVSYFQLQAIFCFCAFLMQNNGLIVSRNRSAIIQYERDLQRKVKIICLCSCQVGFIAGLEISELPAVTAFVYICSNSKRNFPGKRVVCICRKYRTKIDIIRGQYGLYKTCRDIL